MWKVFVFLFIFGYNKRNEWRGVVYMKKVEC